MSPFANLASVVSNVFGKRTRRTEATRRNEMRGCYRQLSVEGLEVRNMLSAGTYNYLYSSAATLNVGDALRLTDYIYAASGSASPSGSVALLDNGAQIAAASLNTNGYGAAYANFAISNLSAGNHSLKVAYYGNGSFQGSTSYPVTENVNAVAVSTYQYLYGSAATLNVGQTLWLSDYIYATSGSASPSGSVALLDNGVQIATAPLNANGYGAAYANFAVSTLSAGTHSLKVAYYGHGTFQGSTSYPVTETVNAIAVSTYQYLYSSAATLNVGDTLRLTDYIYAASGSASSSGSVALLDNGVQIATAPLNANGYGAAYANFAVSNLSAGFHSLKAMYYGNGAFQSISSSPVTETINNVAASTYQYLYSSAATLNFGDTLRLTDYIYAASGSASPNGSMALLDNGVQVATAPLNANGYGAAYASFAVSNLSAGLHSLKAVYYTTASFQGSTSYALAETVNTLSLPNINTDAGLVARMLIAESLTPTAAGYNANSVLLGMQAMLAAVNNRLHYNQGNLFMAPNAKSLSDIILAPNQIQGFSRNSAGQIIIDPIVQARINDVINRANAGQSDYVAFVRNAVAVATGPINDPFSGLTVINGIRVLPGAFAWWATGVPGRPSGNYVAIPNGVIAGTQFYALPASAR
jgi:hypothetical protein